MSKRSKPDYNLRKKLGKRVRQLRLQLNISQEELGFRTDLHRTYIGAVERGEQNISLDNLGKLAKNLKVSLQELFNF